MMNGDMAAALQASAVGDQVTLYQLDTTPLGGITYYFTASVSVDDQPIVFDGQTYFPIPMEAEGFELNGKGSFPRPRLRISNVNQVIQGAVIEFDDLLGSALTRIRTLRQFLDDGDNPNPEAFMPLDIYVVDRKSSQNKIFIEWELASVIDQEGIKLPRRQVLKDACTHIYRVWNANTLSFETNRVTCPYTASNYFTAAGAVTTDPALDRCGKRLSDCRLRFGANSPLPTRAFPGVGAY